MVRGRTIQRTCSAVQCRTGHQTKAPFFIHASQFQNNVLCYHRSPIAPWLKGLAGNKLGWPKHFLCLRSNRTVSQGPVHKEGSVSALCSPDPLQGAGRRIWSQSGLVQQNDAFSSAQSGVIIYCMRDLFQTLWPDQCCDVRLTVWQPLSQI